MSNQLQNLDSAEKALAESTTPEETMQLESISKAAIAYAKEEGMYEELVKIWRFFIKAHRRTTELYIPKIRTQEMGRPNKYDKDVLLIEDAGFTPKQWSRRKKILEVADEQIEDYLSDCIEKNLEPSIAGLMKFAWQIIESTTGDEWWTPAKYMNSVHEVLGGIDLDPATCHEANEVVRANTIYTIEDDGLQQPWFGRVFINPPYSRNKDFAQKMVYEYEKGTVEQAVVLLGAHAIETNWFSDYWNYILCFTGHRITFNTPSGEAKAGNIAGSVFIYLGDDQIKFADEFSKHGYVVKRWPD